MSEIRLSLPLNDSLIPKATKLTAVLEAGASPIERQPLAGGLPAPGEQTLTDRQWTIGIKACQVTFELQTDPSEPVLTIAGKLDIDLDVGELTTPDHFVLLRGSLALPKPPSGWGGYEQLWPVAGAGRLKEVRIEPSGVHLRGELPDEFFPDGESKDVVLRIPQHARDILEIKDSDAIPFWTLSNCRGSRPRVFPMRNVAREGNTFVCDATGRCTGKSGASGRSS